MLDIRLFRESPDLVRHRLARRGQDVSTAVDAILDCDAQRRAAETRQQKLNGERKRLSKEIGAMRGHGEDTTSLETQVKGLGDELARLDEEVALWNARQRDLLLTLPNMPHERCPEGADASANPVVRTWGSKPVRADSTLDHMTIAESLGLLDSTRAAKVSGSGFMVFTGAGARLERALINYLLDTHALEHGYTEISPPFLVRRDCMVGTSQLPKFEDDMYGLEDGSMFLVPTAEVPVTNLHREEILDEADLPRKFVAYTPCFRREAGSAGRDTRGLIRLHQFDKVELVKLCKPEDSYSELESLTADAERVLQSLGLHYRVIELCGGDLGFGSAKTYDIEVWAPGQQAYLEVSSCSNFEDYQARRMNLRYKDATSKKNIFCHTLNGSGTALPRLYVALIETYAQPDGSVPLPEPLHKYYGRDRL